MPRSEPNTKEARDDIKDAMRSAVEFGEAAGELSDLFRWQLSRSDEVMARELLRQVQRVGREARDVLDMMEENDG